MTKTKKYSYFFLDKVALFSVSNPQYHIVDV